MLILFDIDGTILLTKSAGLRAMADAIAEHSGREISFDGIDTSGRLDPLIWAEVAAKNGVKTSDDLHDQFRAAYHRHMQTRLGAEKTATLLPGVAELVRMLGGIDGYTLGLLTGNYPETGRLKLTVAGMDPDIFTLGAWGSDGPTRRHLPRVAMDHYNTRNGGQVDPKKVLIIGDTPHDIDCARHNGCRVLAVATGRFSVEELESHRPDHVVRDLNATSDLLAWIGDPAVHSADVARRR